MLFPHRQRKPRSAFGELVDYCARTDSTQTIQNASMEHALIIAKKLFEKALETGDKVRIVSGRLYDPFYNALVDDVKAVLENSEVSAIVVAQADNEFVSLLRNSKNGSLCFLGKDPSTQVPHYIVVGNSRYRAELDDERVTAIASFNNDAIGRMLVDNHRRLLDIFPCRE